ncbi:MAG: hypothetical protein AAB070_04865 [Candidatus Binatota bacterium]
MAANIGKYLAFTIMFFVVAILIIVFFKEGFVDKFLEWTLKIIYAVVGGTVIYIIIKLSFGRKR